MKSSGRGAFKRTPVGEPHYGLGLSKLGQREAPGLARDL